MLLLVSYSHPYLLRWTPVSVPCIVTAVLCSILPRLCIFVSLECRETSLPNISPQVFREARRVAPSVVFIPRISSWWGVTTEALQATFLAALLSLPSSTPLLVLATAEEKWAELPRPLRDVFRGVRFG